MAQVKEEFLNAVKEAQAAMQSIQMELGAIALAELRKEVLMKAYKEQQEKIQQTTEAIREEYGDGSVNLESGEFTAEAQVEA
jgi:FMN-dependent NADH-azoreductase